MLKKGRHARQQIISSTKSKLCSNSISVSPGKPTMMSVVMQYKGWHSYYFNDFLICSGVLIRPMRFRVPWLPDCSGRCNWWTETRIIPKIEKISREDPKVRSKITAAVEWTSHQGYVGSTRGISLAGNRSLPQEPAAHRLALPPWPHFSPPPGYPRSLPREVWNGSSPGQTG